MRRLFAIALLVASVACAAPFSELQSARLAGRGVIEITPSYSYVDGKDEVESAKLQDNLGLQIATGLSSVADLRVRIEHMRVDVSNTDLDFSATAFGIGPKFALIPDHLALFVPVGFALGGDISQSDTWQLHPTVVWTIPISDMFEVNSSFKALVPLTMSDNNDVHLAFNVGLGVGPNLSRWAIRPEFGMMKVPCEEHPCASGTVRHLSIGATFYLGRN